MCNYSQERLFRITFSHIIVKLNDVTCNVKWLALFIFVKVITLDHKHLIIPTWCLILINLSVLKVEIQKIHCMNLLFPFECIIIIVPTMSVYAEVPLVSMYLERYIYILYTVNIYIYMYIYIKMKLKHLTAPKS